MGKHVRRTVLLARTPCLSVHGACVRPGCFAGRARCPTICHVYVPVEPASSTLCDPTVSGYSGVCWCDNCPCLCCPFLMCVVCIPPRGVEYPIRTGPLHSRVLYACIPPLVLVSVRSHVGLSVCCVCHCSPIEQPEYCKQHRG